MNKFMQLAIDEARKGIHNGHGGPFGAVIVKNGQVISIAHNDVLEKGDPTSHAEIEAIREASRNLDSPNLFGCEIYTTGKPCPMCESAIKWAKIQQVYYGCDYEDARKIDFDECSGNSKEYNEKQIHHKECQELYDEYKSLNSQRY